MKLSILHIEDSKFIAVTLEHALIDILQGEGYEFEYVWQDSLEDIENKIMSFKPNLLILDLILRRENTFDHIESFKSLNPEMIIIVTSAHTDIRKAFDTIRLGASYYLVKDDNLLSDFYVALYSSIDIIVLEKKLKALQSKIYNSDKYQSAILNYKENKPNLILDDSPPAIDINRLNSLELIDIVQNYSYKIFTDNVFRENAFYIKNLQRNISILMISFIDSNNNLTQQAGNYLFSLILPEYMKEYFPDNNKLFSLTEKLKDYMKNFETSKNFELKKLKQFMLHEIQDMNPF